MPASVEPDRAGSSFNVAAAYAHGNKILQSGPLLELPQARLKWYDLAASDTPVPAPIHEQAREHLRREAASGRLALDSDLGFVILHRCGLQFHFLLLCTWRNENELWETVLARPDDAHPEFTEFKFGGGAHRGTFCVWELAAVWHEQQAWRRYLLGARDEAARAAWLADTTCGEV